MNIHHAHTESRLTRGIWEVRGDPTLFASSKLTCWIALERRARLAELHERAADRRVVSALCEIGEIDRGRA